RSLLGGRAASARLGGGLLGGPSLGSGLLGGPSLGSGLLGGPLGGGLLGSGFLPRTSLRSLLGGHRLLLAGPMPQVSRQGGRGFLLRCAHPTGVLSRFTREDLLAERRVVERLAAGGGCLLAGLLAGLLEGAGTRHCGEAFAGGRLRGGGGSTSAAGGTGRGHEQELSRH